MNNTQIYTQVGRLPVNSISDDDLKNGAVILPIIGIIYLYGGIYILNRKYFYPTISHLIGLIDEKYTPAVYCSLNMMIYLFVMLYSTLLAQDNIGISTVLGSDAINLLLVMGLVQYKAKEFTPINVWIFMKDTAFYLVTLVFGVVYFFVYAITWWMALIWLVYFGSYAFYFQKKNEKLRDKIALFLGLKDEDDVFSSAELQKMPPRRRYSITTLIAEDCINTADPELQKRIRRHEGALRIQIKDQKKIWAYSIIQRAVHIVMFAIQNKINKEKRLRSEVFREKVDRLYGRVQKKQNSLGKQDNMKGDDENDGLDAGKKDEEENLITRDGRVAYPYNENNDDVPAIQTPQGASQGDVLNKAQNKELIEEPRVDDLGGGSNPNLDDDVYAFEDDNMAIPKSAGKKIIYFLFFPVNFLYFVVLFYFRKQVNIKAAVFSMTAIIILQAAFSFLIIWWTEIVINALGISSEIAGISFTSIGFSISFVAYNLKFQSSETNAEFFTTFEMIGIYKFGFAATVAWLISFAVDQRTSFNTITQGFGVSTLIYLGLFAASAIWIAINKVKITKVMMVPYVIAYLVFLPVAIVAVYYLTALAFTPSGF